ncbi:MAG TPA: DUF1835 domain-containing protein [Gemmatimonadaceae bacterium]|nr:DUF1835 domain-containing protein [Gemmatimonadaceae bacterium]
MLHITNGDSAAQGIRQSGVPGEVLPWRDVLHDGPVPSDVSFNQLRAIRARFIADCGWRPFEEALREFTERDKALERALTHDEIVLWFEHDLYDQLQLLQLLDWFTRAELGATKLTLICDAEYLGPSAPQRLAERFPSRTAVSEDAFGVARRAWAAFRSATPTDIEAITSDETRALPFVAPALLRHLEQFPSTTNGLSRTEQQAFDAIANGTTKLAKIFPAIAQAEDAVFLGDASFAAYLSALSNTGEPLVRTASGDVLKAPWGRGVWEQDVTLTAAGEAVRAGIRDHVEINGIDRWLGGVHLEGRTADWRWDPSARRIVPASNL